jgi:hypothetical protein
VVAGNGLHDARRPGLWRHSPGHVGDTGTEGVPGSDSDTVWLLSRVIEPRPDHHQNGEGGVRLGRHLADLNPTHTTKKTKRDELRHEFAHQIRMEMLRVPIMVPIWWEGMKLCDILWNHL